MDSLPGPFTIEINGKPISKLSGPLDESSAGPCKHAETGSEPAVFELSENRLMSNGHMLTRYMVEDMSLMPKRVYWFRADDHDTKYRVVAKKNGDGYSLTMSGIMLRSASLCSLLTFVDATLTVRDGAIYADLLQRKLFPL